MAAKKGTKKKGKKKVSSKKTRAKGLPKKPGGMSRSGKY